MWDILEQRGGESNPTHACMPGSAIRCSNIRHIPTGCRPHLRFDHPGQDQSPRSKWTKVDASRPAQINMAGYDTLGACIFAGFGFSTAPAGFITRLLKARLDWDAPDDILQFLGKETLKMEREFNDRAGFTSKDDRLPEYMTHEPIPPTNAVFDVPDEELGGLFNC